MLSGPQRPIILLAFFLIAPIVTLASSIEVNSVCEVGTCPLPTNTLAPGSSIPVTNFNFEAVINGDTYDFYGNYSAYNTSNSPSGSVGITLDATAVYEGNAPTVQDDEILLNDLQNNTVPGSFNLKENYQESLTASFSGTLVKNTSLRGQTFFNGGWIGQLRYLLGSRFQHGRHAPEFDRYYPRRRYAGRVRFRRRNVARDIHHGNRNRVPYAYARAGRNHSAGGNPGAMPWDPSHSPLPASFEKAELTALALRVGANYSTGAGRG